MDGRDTLPTNGAGYLEELQQKMREFNTGTIASVNGRYYAMDRDHRWPRIQAAYDLITGCAAEFQAPDAVTGLEMAYARGETDEFVKGTWVLAEGAKPVTVADGDVLISMNYRSDRARQITRPFIERDFDCFERRCKPHLGMFVSLTEYSADFDVPVAFPPERMRNVFGEYVSKLGLRQLRIAETEKYAHVTFFFNGGREEPFEFEDRILIPSPNVATYDLQPEMSAPQVTDHLVEAIGGGKYDVIICNYANGDMVGHTGNFGATVKAIEALDGCLGRISEAALKAGGEILITADHGNAEQMVGDDTGQPHTAHTSNVVPLIYVGERPFKLSPGVLSDIAPTMLALMEIEPPIEMTGRSLIAPADAPDGEA